MIITIDVLGMSAAVMVAISVMLFFFFPALACLALKKDNQVIDSLLEWIAYKGAWVYAFLSVLTTFVVAVSIFGKVLTPEMQNQVDVYFKHMLLNSTWVALYTVAVRIHDYTSKTKVSY